LVRPILDKPIGIISSGDKPSKPGGRPGRRPDGGVVSETPKGIHQLR